MHRTLTNPPTKVVGTLQPPTRPGLQVMDHNVAAATIYKARTLDAISDKMANDADLATATKWELKVAEAYENEMPTDAPEWLERAMRPLSEAVNSLKTSMTADLGQLKTELHQANLGQLAANLRQLTVDVGQLKTEFHQADLNLRQLTVDIGQLKVDLGQVKADLLTVQGDTTRIKEDVGQLKVGVEAANASIFKLGQRLIRAQNAERADGTTRKYEEMPLPNGDLPSDSNVPSVETAKDLADMNGPDLLRLMRAWKLRVEGGPELLEQRQKRAIAKHLGIRSQML